MAWHVMQRMLGKTVGRCILAEAMYRTWGRVPGVGGAQWVGLLVML